MDDKLIPVGKASKMIGVSVDTLRRWDKKGKLIAVRNTTSGNRYYHQKDVELLSNNSITTAQQWVHGSSQKTPQTNFHCRTRDVFQARLENFQDKLIETTNIQTASLVIAIAGEIGHNSFDHNLGNWPDTLGIFFAVSPNKQIVLADRGQGILTTLKRVDPTLKTHAQALTVAFTKTLSARPNEARGNGLKFVKAVVTSNPFKLSFQTGNALLKLSKKKSLIKVSVVQEPIRGCLAVIDY